MSRDAVIGWAMAVGWAMMPSPSQGQDPKRDAAPAPDIKVVFWSDGTTVRFQTYDVRKGQYTKAVDDWVDRYPFDGSGPAAYVVLGRWAYVREFRLEKGKGKTEQEQLTAAIARELKQINEAELRSLRTRGVGSERGYYAHAIEGRRDLLGRDIGRRTAPAPRPSLDRMPGAGVIGPSSPSYPFPYPYPRPHP